MRLKKTSVALAAALAFVFLTAEDCAPAPSTGSGKQACTYNAHDSCVSSKKKFKRCLR